MTTARPAADECVAGAAASRPEPVFWPLAFLACVAACLPALLTACHKRTERSLAEDTVRSCLTGSARTWALLGRLRRTDRRWQRTVRRRPHSQLLPPPYDSRAYSSVPASS